MALTPGTRLGPYEVTAQIGAGGMGEVYEARDTRLDRTVAIKVLPSEVAGDSDVLSRFEREARTVAGLDHPHICGIYDVGHVNGTHYLVMPHLDGQTLAARLEKGRLPLEQALKIATEIADALDKAHRQGVTHRDLKPANIMLTKAGAKLLDFGLAKLRRPVVPVSISGATTAAAAATATGTILGTIHYMAPEQVEGREADTRSDIWALGIVIYEMATGERPFEGKSAASVIGAILKDSPAALSSREPLTPPTLDHLVGRCLEKDPDERWQNAGDLKWSLIGLSPAGLPTAPAAAVRRGTWAKALFAAAILTSGLAAGLVLGLAWRSGEESLPRLVQFEVLPPLGVTLSPSPIASTAQLAVSPDGTRLAFVAAARRSAPQIWIRALDGLEIQPLAGTDGAAFPFWSPDSRSLAFFAGGKLKRIDTAGGSPQVLADAVGRGGTWNANDVIVFASQPNSVLLSIPASGGAARPVAALGSGDIVGQNWPLFLPDGRHVLFYQRSRRSELQGVSVVALDSPDPVHVLRSDGMPIYGSGFLGSVRDGTLFVQPFDERTLVTSGPPVRVADNIGYFSGSFGFAAVSMSPGGILAYGPGVRLTTSLRWIDRTGAVTQMLGGPDVYSSPRLSPDQRTVALAVAGVTMAQRDIWLLDVARGTSLRGTFDPAADWFPVWSADGSRVFFGTTREGVTTIYQRVGSGSDEPVLKTSAALASYPFDASSDGQLLALVQSTSSGYDVAVLGLSAERQVTGFLTTPFNEVQPRFSPNTRWMAYASDESGQFEIYVRSFPTGSAQKKISAAGGMQPEWRRDGKELFYVSPEGKMMSVSVTTDAPLFDAGDPVPLFDVEMPQPNAPYPNEYAVSADARRFLVNTVIDQPTRQTLTVILNWREALKLESVTASKRESVTRR